MNGWLISSNRPIETSKRILRTECIKQRKIKPVVIDESLTDFETFQLAREQGYSGVALKACKGQSQALLMGAAAIEYDMFLAVQDLTCPGASFLHSAGLAARVPRVTAIEGNARQFCPVANEGWKDKFPSIFNIADGTVGTHVLTGMASGISASVLIESRYDENTDGYRSVLWLRGYVVEGTV